MPFIRSIRSEYVRKRISNAFCANLSVKSISFLFVLLQSRGAMISVLRSIDLLLYRFDEISQHHSNLVSTFETSFTETENPLREILRDEDEQRQTAETFSMLTAETDERQVSFENIEDFNRRIVKSRSGRRPPSYASNDNTLLANRTASRSSWITTESAPATDTAPRTRTPPVLNAAMSQPVTSTTVHEFTETKAKLTAGTRSRVAQQTSPAHRRSARPTITAFTIETVNRLSKPKTYNQSPDRGASLKRAYHRSKPSQHSSRPTLDSSIPSILSAASRIHGKPTIPTVLKSSPKKLKGGEHSSTNNSKKIPMSNYPRPVVHLAPPPTISLTFPMQSERQSSRVVVPPSSAFPPPAGKTANILTNKRTIKSFHRMMYLLT